jgi:uncharacterized membrane protein YphA (DoxX/SURF4 family)
MASATAPSTSVKGRIWTRGPSRNSFAPPLGSEGVNDVEPAKKERLRVVFYWVTTILGPASFVIGGFLFLTHAEPQVAQITQLGYPPYLLRILGAWKVLGALAVVVPGLPRLKEWAYAGFFFELTGAAASHAFAGHGAGEILAPLAFLALVMASAALRPASRRCASWSGSSGQLPA